MEPKRNCGAGRETNATLMLSNVGPADAGSYAVIISNPAGTTNSNSALLTVNPSPPDLFTLNLSTASNLNAGQLLSIGWIVTNGGVSTAIQPWQEKLLLANNPVGTDAFVLSVVSVTNSLAASNAVGRALTVILPAGLAGNYWFIVQVDSADAVEEDTGEANNFFVSSGPVLIQSPDLRIPLLTSAASATFGQPFSVTWAVTNSGNGVASGNWSDHVWVSLISNSVSGATRLSSAGVGVSSLQPSASYANNAIVTIPLVSQSQPGMHWLVVQADGTGTVSESNEGNNLRSVPLTLNLPPLPDLVAGNVGARRSPFAVLTNASPGQTIPVTWTLTNIGPAAALSPWTETIRLVSHQITTLTNPAQFQNLLASAATLGTFAHTSSLAAGAFLARTQFVALPLNGLSGDLRLVVTVDARDEVFEETETNNVGIASEVLRVPASLSLQLSTSQISEEATTPIHATLTRNGDRSQPLLVTVTNGAPGELSIIPSLPTATKTNITFAVGQAAVMFDLFPVRDRVVDGDQLVPLHASAPGYEPASAVVTVLNADLPTLTLAAATNRVDEGFAVALTVSRDIVTSNSITVTLTSSSPSQFSPPTLVTIPGAASSASFAVLAVDDAKAEAPASFSLSAAAPGFNGGSASVIVLDNDVPTLTVSLSTHSVSEGAGPQAASMTVTRNPAGPGPLNIEPFVGDSALVYLPLQITIPPGQSSRSFPVGVVNDSLVNGTRAVALSAYALAAGSGERLSTALAPDVLTVTDDDGPTLKLDATLKLVREGLNPATTVTLTRNTPATNQVLVTLTSDRTNEATVPASVSIPAGAASVTFPMTTVADNTDDGNQTVVLRASAPEFADGLETLVVSDTDLPDLVVGSVSAPTAAVPQERVALTYRVVNQGLSTSAGEFLTRVFLSRDAIIGDDVLVAQFRNTNRVPVGSFIQSAEQIQLPLEVGNFWVVVETDAEQTLAEVLENNNTTISAAPIAVAADYAAWVQTDVTSAPANTPVPLNGQATNSLGVPVAARPVNIHLRVRGTERVLSVTTDTNGAFATVFTPLPNEAGRYDVFATHPGVKTIPVQDTFKLLGFRANPANVSLTIVEGTKRSGSVTLENLSDVLLTGLTVEVVSKPATLTVNASVPGSQLATQTALNYSLTAPTADAGGRVQLRVTSAEGVEHEIAIGVHVEPLRPRLVATPVSLYSAMPVGGQAMVAFDVANLGGRESGPVALSLPAVPWMHVASANPMPSLAPGQTNRITLLLTPARTLPLGPYTGSLVLNGDGTSLSVPFTFRAMSVCVGDLAIEAVDEFTYYAEGAPRLAGANVVVRDAYTRTNVATGVTDTNGHFFVSGLEEAYYEIEVTADKHSTYRTTHLLKAGLTNEVQTFLSRQTVTYTWTVEPVEFEDRYRVIIDTTFETVVPMPVVTIEPNVIDLAEITADETHIDIKITNHGLIAANNTRLNFPTDRSWHFRPLIENIGVLPARSSVTIPLTIRRTPLPLAELKAGGPKNMALPSSDPCYFTAKVCWELVCGPLTNGYCAFVSMPTGRLDCGGGGGGELPICFDCGGGPPGIYVPPLVHSTNAPCDPCEFKRLGALLGCVIDAIPIPVKFLQCLREEVACIKDLLTNGLTVGNAAGCLGFALNCGGKHADDLAKKVPLSGWILTAISCSYEVCTACDEIPGYQGFCGTIGPGESSNERLAGLGKAKFQILAPPAKLSTADSLVEQAERLRALVAPTIYFFESERWIHVTDFAALEGVLVLFDSSIQAGSSGEQFISSTEQLQLTAVPTPAPLEATDIIALVNRWNRTMSNYATGVFHTEQVNPSAYTNFIAFDQWSLVSTAASQAADEYIAEGFTDPAAAWFATRNTLIAELQSGGDGVCAKVKLRLEQEAVLTRDGFRATLELENNGASRLENVRIDVNIRSEAGSTATNLFAVRLEGTNTLSAVDGTGILAGNSTGTAKWLLIPTIDAAPEVETRYFVGGTLSYHLDGSDITAPLAEVPIRVLPSPRLTLKYFHQRDVFSDDPFTDAIEPAIPYSLAVMVQNRGYGQAKNFRITSAQPQIIENDKGLLIDFNIIATEVFKAGTNYGLTPSLTANFGDIKAGDTAISRWLLTSTLQGLFIDYSARFEHIDGLGNPRLSLIDEVTIHEMDHLVQATGIWEDGKPDFLVNEVPDIRDYPDTLYQSNGSTNPVQLAEQATPSGAPSTGNLQITLTAPMSWAVGLPVTW